MVRKSDIRFRYLPPIFWPHHALRCAFSVFSAIEDRLLIASADLDETLQLWIDRFPDTPAASRYQRGKRWLARRLLTAPYALPAAKSAGHDASKGRHIKFEWVAVDFPAIFADIATPFFIARNNLRGESAAAKRIANRLGKPKLFAVKALFGMIYFCCKLIDSLLGRDFALGFRLFEGVDRAQYVDPFGYNTQRGSHSFKHDIPQDIDSPQPSTDAGADKLRGEFPTDTITCALLGRMMRPRLRRYRRCRD